MTPLFQGYIFVLVTLQWHAVRWSRGIVRIVMDGDRPALCPDDVIAELRGRARRRPDRAAAASSPGISSLRPLFALGRKRTNRRP
jgi:transcription antitermination factor NusG